MSLGDDALKVKANSAWKFKPSVAVLGKFKVKRLYYLLNYFVVYCDLSIPLCSHVCPILPQLASWVFAGQAPYTFHLKKTCTLIFLLLSSWFQISPCPCDAH